MFYGPGQVIVVAGVNKITDNLDEAIKWNQTDCSTLDAKRLGKSTPCATLGRCIDCNHKERFCNVFVLITGQFIKEPDKSDYYGAESGILRRQQLPYWLSSSRIFLMQWKPACLFLIQLPDLSLEEALKGE